MLVFTILGALTVCKLAECLKCCCVLCFAVVVASYGKGLSSVDIYSYSVLSV